MKLGSKRLWFVMTGWFVVLNARFFPAGGPHGSFLT